ncbi:MAG: Crp/Fnr family transcriptional regulator [Firmicutes bacterium]|nr:Crp/Fnr family transcriptional regulator [Bacillota bacterium]
MRDRLKQVPLFAQMDDDDLERLAQIVRVAEYRRGEQVFLAGDPGDAFYMVISGSVRIYILSEDGREKTLTLLGPGEFFGEMALVDDAPRSASAQALEFARLMVLSRGAFTHMITTHPDMAIKVIRVLSQRLREANSQMEQLAFGDVRGRVAAVLLDLAQRYPAPARKELRIAFRLTQQELAHLTGTARETVTRVLGEFQDRGWIRIDERHYVVCAPERLRELAASRIRNA